MKEVQKILIVRFSSIGDIVLTSPVVRCIKEQLGWEIHFITKSKFRIVLDYNPQIDKIYTIEKEIDEVMPKLKKEKYDLIIDLHKNLRSKRLIFSLGVKSISFDKINFEKWVRIYTRINRLPKKHLVDRYFEGISSLGVKNDGHGLGYYHGLNEVEMSHLLPDEKYVAIVLGATYYTKRIPLEKLEYILGNSRLKCVLIGGGDVEDLGKELADKFPNVINKTAQLTLSESAAIVLNSKYTITGDTGMMHIAAAYKVPTIIFWGSTAYELGMYPYYGEKHSIKSIHLVNAEINCSPCSKIGKDVCPKGHFKCMMDLKEEQILDGIRQMESLK